MKKKLISVCVAVFMLLSTLLFAVAAPAVPEITVKQNIFQINVTIVTEQAADKAVAAYMRSANTEDKKLYGIDDTRSYTEENGKFVYEITFTMYKGDLSGDYVVYVNVDGVVTTAEFSFLNTQEKVDFYNKLDKAEAKDVYAILTGEESKNTYDLTAYKALNETVRAFVDAEIASWSLATQLDNPAANDYIGKVETAFYANMDEVMIRANIANAEADSFDAAVKAAAEAGKLDATYYEEVEPEAVCGFMDSEAVESISYETLAKDVANATLLAVHDTMDYLTLKDAYLYYVEKGIVSIDADKYEQLQDENLADKLFKNLKAADVADVDALETALEKEMDKMVKELEEESSSGNSRPSSGGGTGGSRPSSGGSGGSRPSSGNTQMGSTTDTGSENKKDPVSFGDLDSAAWAKDAIIALAEDGVLSGRGNGVFAPNDIVTREEFVKMIVLAFNGYEKDATCDFVDVAKDRWSYSYIASANRLGLVTGVDSTHFDPAGVITREQMAVILTRALEKAGIGANNSSVSFADANSISAYAKDAVGNLVALGVMNGMGDNTFAPKANVTRAQAAKAIYETVKKAGVK